MPFQRPVGVKVDNKQTPPTFIRPLRDKRALVGQNIVLECQIEAHPDPVIKWLKDGHNVSQCPDYQLSEQGKSYRLHIPSAQASDCGRFSIQAMNAAGIKQSTCMLIVAPAPTPVPGGMTSVASSPAPPQTPVGPSAPFFLKELKHQPLRLGAAAVMEARVVGVPVPTIEWLKNGQVLNNYRVKTEYDAQSGICLLTIPQMFAEDVGEYGCKASNAMGTALSSAQVMPQEQYDAWFSDEQRQITRDKKQRLLQAARQQQQQQSRRTPQQGYTPSPRSTPAYIQRQLDQWGQSPAGGAGFMSPASEVSDSLPEATDPAAMAPVFRNKLRGLRLTESTDAVLQCNVIGVPKPKIYWLRNGRPLAPTSRSQTHYGGTLALLKISMMSPEDSGEYTIVAENQHGQAQSSARVEVYPLSSTPSFDPLLSTLASSSQQALAPTRQSAQQPVQPAQSQLRAVQQRQQPIQLQKEQPAAEAAVQKQPSAPIVPPKRTQPQQQQQQVVQQQQPHPKYQESVSEVAVQPAQPRQQLQTVQAQQPLRDPNFRLRSPPKEYYHQHERVIKQQPQVETAYQQQQPNWSEQLDQLLKPVEQQLNFSPEATKQLGQQEKQQQQPPPHSLQATYQPPQQQQPYQQLEEGQQLQHQAEKQQIQQQKSKAEWEIDEWLLDPFGASQSPSKVHPYLKPPEQVEYFLQEQQRRQQQRMAPPPALAQKNGPVANGVHAPAKQQMQQRPQQQQQIVHKQMTGAPPGGGPVKPPQFLEMPKPLAVNPGEKAVFSAKTTGQPMPELSWMSLSQPQRKLAAESKKFQIVGGKDGQSQLTILSVQEQDLGVYACVASNAGGSFQAQFALQFASSGQQQQQQQNLQRNTAQMSGQNQQNQQFVGAQNQQNLNMAGVKSSAGGAGSTRQKFQSPSPAPSEREQVILKRVDRSKQFTTAKRPHLDEERPPSSQPPQFSSPLKNQTLIEGQHALLDCKFTPTDDPNLKVAWLLNGKPVIATSRVTTLNEFGYAVLEINPVTVFDHGEYTCIAVNTMGEARQTAQIEVLSHVPLQQQEDQVVPARTLAPGKDRPSFRKDLRSQELFEGQPLHLETKLTPINDPTMKINYFLNGNPVQQGDRVKCQFENGFALLSIDEVSEKDAGYYVFQAENDIGQAETSATVVVVPRMDSSMYLAESETAVVDVDDMRELQVSQTAGQMHAPQFTQPPRDFHCEDELGRSYFDARIAPVNDPTLRVIWLKDGQPLPNANRIQLVNNFGFVSLSIHPTYPEDAGTYTCLLRNSLGESSANAQLSTVSTEPLQLDPLHAEALPTIQSIEEYQVHIGPVSVERPEELQSLEQPKFVRPLGGRVEVDMEQPVHFECRVQPANDVRMSVEWLLNGLPLAAAHRFRPMFDFGYVALDILYAYPEDSGTYTCIARNELGEAQSSMELVVNTKQTLFQDPLHPEGLERIQELEQPRDYSLQEVPDRECDNPPKFLGNLQNVELSEGDDLCFEIKLVPVNDPTMQVEWFLNEQPLYFGSRIHAQNDFGFITLSIRGVIPEDSGTYTVRATNEKGQDSRSCEVSVLGKDAILSAPQHEESLGKIEYLENLQKFVRPEIPDYEPTAPQFVEALPGDLGEVEEGEPLHMECKVEPVGDNQLRVYWLRDGHPLPHAHRFRTFYDFGFVSLDILSVYAEDSGQYTCVAENALGQAQTNTQFTCQPKSLIYTDTQHPESYARIQEIEAPRPLPEEVPEPEKQAPFFTKPLNASSTEVAEGENIYLEAQYGPLDDNTIQCEWLFNGQPLMKAHRFVLSQDFGFAALSILYMYPEDSGTYTLVIRNGQGQETSSSIDLSCGGKEALLLDTLHPDSVQRIAELEAPRPMPEEAPEPEKQAPQIVKQLTVTSPSSEGPAETQSLHFDAQFTPTDDNTVVVEWFHNGQPMKNSNRYHLSNDFGFAALDINFLLTEDAGEYTLVVSNAIGQAQTSASIQFEGSAVIIEDTQHPESLRRIQEIEAIRPAEPTEPELPPEAPSFTQQLNGQIQDLAEGQPLHLDASVMPVTDPKLRIEWYFNGQPLAFSSRIRTIHDFGYVALEFAHLFAEDTGTYTCRAINDVGEAESSITIECQSKRNLYLESQHEQSWAKIQEMENREMIKEPSPELHFPPPTFIVPLENFENLIEGEAVRLECRLQPVNDPTLKVFWTCNEQPLPEGNRFMPARNLDLVTLDIMTVYGEDSGLYTCRAVSDFGEAQTTATIKCQPTDALMLDVQHEQSWQQIQELESRQPEEIIMPEQEIVAPRFVQPLPGSLPEFQEGDPIHLEAQIEPTNDNQLVVEWFFNGQPLPNGHRFRKVHDFGYVSLDILYSFAHDSGEYVCVARNALGEAQSQTNLQIAAKDSLFLDPQHENSWQKIQELEAPRPAPPEMEPPPKEAPNFIEPLQSLDRIEGQPAHFQTRVTPVNDNQLQIQWFKDGQPLGDSNRFAFTKDFGLIALDLLHTVANDAGTYTCVATNELGEARVEAQLTVQPVPSLLLDPLHEQSWNRIQELEAPKEMPEEAAEVDHGPPRFTQQLNSQNELIEGQPAHFEAQVEPITDPNLRVQWFHNGHPLAASNRFAIRNDFGLVTLDIHYVLAQDIGDYRCVAVNNQGEASTEGHLDCQRRPDLLLDPQHEESWRRIQEMEAPKEMPEEPEPTPFPKPQFTQPMQSQADVPEGSVVLFEARVIPIDDPNLQIQWFRNDQPLMQSNRYAIGEEFGHVWLRIGGVGLHDSGVYSCKAVNKEGAAMTNASLSVAGDERLILDTQHAESYARIQELEAMEKYPRLEYPDMEFGKPVWTKTFENVEVDTEGGIVQLIGHVEPVGDPNLRVEWSLNGVPLMNANRFRQECNFGEVTLFIIHVLPHDSGVYSCRAYNLQGEATTSATVKVAGYEAIMADSQHPQSWERIQELETPRIIEEIEIPEVKEKPRFLTQLESVDDVPEGTPIRLEATFQPARDNDLTISWDFNGSPLGASQLIRTRQDLGWAALDINGVNMDHVGVYTLKIANSEGEAATSASVKVAGVGDILADTQHEESWRRIQQLEAPREREPSPPPPEYDAPTFQQQIADIECDEGEPSKFEAAFLPNNDPNVKIQWVRNGVPLCHGSKYAISQDFGYCTLVIGYTFPEDAGVYQLCVQNDKGEAITSATLKCNPKDSIIGDVQHEESWRRIQEIEAPREAAPEAEPAPKQPPKFTSPVLTPGEVHEGQPAHFETTVEPIDDPELKIQWFFEGTPVASSSRLKMISDFGWVILNIADCGAQDSGTWECVATNSVGEARASAQLSVQSKERLLLDPINQASFNKIQEIEAPKPLPEEMAPPEYEAPQISTQLTAPDNLNEGDSAHLEARFTPVNDPNLKVEWYKDGQPLYNSNRHRMVSDFGFGILDILYLLAHDAGEYTLRVFNDKGEASTSVQVAVQPSETLLLQPQNENKAKAVQELEDSMQKRPPEEELPKEQRMPVFVSPLSAPSQCEQGDRAHFTARYEPLDDNQLQIQWFLNGRPLFNGSRVKTINDFGIVVLEIYPVYPEDSGEYVCKAINAAGEAVTSTQLSVAPKEGIEYQPQLPPSIAAGAQQKIHELESRVPVRMEQPEKEHGPPRFTSQFPSLPQMREGALVHVDAQLEPVDDPTLKVEWFHNGELVRNTARMKAIHDFGFVVLELCPAEPQDNGTWVCRATNAQGTAEIQCELEVVCDSGISYEWVSPGERKERIEELEDWINRPKAELQAPAAEYEAPKFTQQLQEAGTIGETESHAFTCVMEPVGDPSLRIEWQHNGHPVPFSNRIQMSNDFGVITLLIKHLITQDTGEYRCIARSEKGEAQTAASITVESIIQVDEPTILQPLVDSIDAAEGESVHLECRVAPINDPKLQVQWLRNGMPLGDANRYRQNFEFGFVTLDILYAYPEDNGDYELVVTNDKGEARTRTQINVEAKPGLIFSPQAPGSNMVDNLEHHISQYTRAQLALSQEDAWQPSGSQPPVFKTQLNNIGVEEGDFCRFETQLAPINDPYMKVEWYRDGKPVLIGTRFRNTLDFGYVCLDLLYALPDDTGEYACVATNQYGQAMLTAKLACSGKQYVITQPQMPQGVRVKDVKKNVYWTESGEKQPPRQRQAPQFLIQPRNLQVVENMPARFECAVSGFPKPRVIWYVNGVQALDGHRYKLSFDGVHYLTIMHTRVSDAGTVEAVARNTEGEVQAKASLDVFQHEDFRQHKLQQAKLKTMEELKSREQQWKEETLGQLGEAFEKAPKGDYQKLTKVELQKAPIEPLETEELVQKFTRAKDEQFYDKLAYVEKAQRDFPGLELEPVELKPGHVSRYQPVQEKLPEVKLRELSEKSQSREPEPLPNWASGDVKLGEPVGKFTQMEEPEPEPQVVHRDQVKLKMAKPKPVPEVEHFTIEEERARMGQPKQGPALEPEQFVPHKDQVQIRQKFKPKETKPHEQGKVEGADKPLKDIPPIVKEEFEKSSVPSKHQKTISPQFTSIQVQHVPPLTAKRPQPTKITPSQKAAPTLSSSLQPVQAEIGRSASFVVAYSGDEPVTVKWFHNGKQIRSAFDTQIRTTPGEARLDLSKLKESHAGEYSVRLENVAGQCESSASLSVSAVPYRGVAPQFSQRVADQRVQQGQTVKLSCVISGSPRPTISWFKDGKQLPNDDRYQQSDSEQETALTIVEALPTDGGIYECVAKNPAGECRCKSRLNMLLTKTGTEAEKGPKQEAPRFADPIKPVLGQEGGNAEFRAKYSGEPEPTIRWSRNNEPIKQNDRVDFGNAEGDAWLRISGLCQEDVAEYKCEAINPVGRASTVANLVLKPAAGKVIGGKPGIFAIQGGAGKFGTGPVGATKSPQFLIGLNAINARQGENVKFVAEIDGDPLPTVQWLFNGKPVIAGGFQLITQEDNRVSLEIKKVTPSNAGTYMCQIRNQHGAAQSEAHLSVQSIPSVPMPTSRP